MWKRYKHESTESCCYLERQIDKFNIRSNSHIFPVRTQTTNTQKMNIYEMSMQNIPNLDLFSSDNSESKRINAEDNLLLVCSMEERK